MLPTKRMLILLALPLVVLAVGLGLLAWWSHRVEPEVGLENGRLRSGPPTPNWVNSEPGTPERAAIAPLTFTGDAAAAWTRARDVVLAAGGRVERESDGYLWATFRSPLLRYVDDLELRLDPAAGVIHVRSASRVGHSDLGKNRRRVEAVRAVWIDPSAPP